MKRWEYKVVEGDIESPGDDEDVLNSRGSEGWELVTVVRDGNVERWYLKREKREKEE